MNLSEPFIKRPVMTILVMASIFFFGLMAFKNLPVSDMPSVDYPTIEVTVNYPGASADLMANSVAAPLERQFTSLDGIQTITSTNNVGSTQIVLQFHLNRNIDDASTDVQSGITAALPDLPDNLPNNPTYKKVNPTDTPVLFYALATNSLTLGELYDYGYSFLGQRLGMVEGVSEIQTYGAPYAVRIQVDPDLLSGKEIGIDQLATTVKEGNPNLPLGVLYGPMVEYTVDADGQIFNAEGYSSLIIRNNKGKMVRISDVGNALNSTQNDKYSLRYIKGDETYDCVVLAVLKQAGSNAVKIIQGIKELLPELEEELPASLQVETIFDQSEWIFESVHDVEFTLVVAFLLVVLVVFFYLGKFIDTIIPVCALPMTVIGTFLVMYLLGYSLDILSLLAITLSIGFLVDDAIVVLENVARHVEMGEKPLKAALEGSKQISFTILSMTLCLASVFIPLIFMGGIIGRIFREFAVTIVVAVIISGIISLTLTPLLCSRFIAPHSKNKKNFIEVLSEKLNNGLLSIYKRGFHIVMRHKLMTLGVGALCLAGTLFFFIKIPKDFLPMDDLGFIEGFSLAPDGTSPYKMMDYQKEIEALVRADPNVDSFVSVGAIPIDSQGLLFIRLKDLKKRQPMVKVVPEMYAKFNEIPGINTFLKPIPLINLAVGTGSTQGNYQYTLQSLGSDDLYSSAETLIEEMKKLPGFIQVSSDMHANEPYVKIKILRDRAFDLNISAESIETALMLAYSGGRVTQINGTLNQYDVIVETIPSAYKDPTVLDKIYVTSKVTSPVPTPAVTYNVPRGLTAAPTNDPGFVQVPLSAIAEWTKTLGPLSINHFNTLPSVTITFDLEDIPLSTALLSLDQAAENILPKSVAGSIQGSANIFRESFADLNFLFIIAIFVIYVILGILYENLIHPITVMSALPPAAVGALLTLIAFGYSLDLYSFVGIIMLIGIVLKNGIIMIDFANEQMVHENKGIDEAIELACFARFRPIIMTTFAAGMGAVPIALGIGGGTAESRRPLGLAIVGGLIFSQILTLFLTPVVFIYMERMRERLHRKKAKSGDETHQTGDGDDS
ncbi:MAG: efflux RND transporter permease subunit [Simkaniaceae bacterium]